MYLILLFREIELLFHRLLGGLQGVLFGGHWPGKTKAFVHAVVIGVLFFSLATGRKPPLLSPSGWVLCAVIAAIGSGVFYFVRYRAVWHKAFVELA
jgi:phosphatidylglycerophosphate synthase